MDAFAQILIIFIQLYTLVIVARALMSWINLDPRTSEFARILYDLTEPVLAPVRKMMPQSGGLDFSPIIVILGLQFLTKLIAATLLGL